LPYVDLEPEVTFPDEYTFRSSSPLEAKVSDTSIASPSYSVPAEAGARVMLEGAPSMYHVHNSSVTTEELVAAVSALAVAKFALSDRTKPETATNATPAIFFIFNISIPF
jgi:hypothetical protein